MAQVLDAPLPRYKSSRLGMQPQLWKCGNPECKNLVSDVYRKSKFRKYCCVDCRNYVNDVKRRERNQTRKIGRKLLPRPCEGCGKMFTPLKKNSSKYCSHLCNTRKLRGNKIDINCGNCGIKLKSMRNKQFCSIKCRLISFHKNKLEVLK